MSDGRRGDPDFEDDLRKAFARARVPAAPSSLREHLDGLEESRTDRRAAGRSLLLLAAALVTLTVVGGALVVGSRRPSGPAPTNSDTPSASAVAFNPPGPMSLFVAGQPTSGDGWRLLGGAAGLPGPEITPPTVDLYTGDGLGKVLDMLGLPLDDPVVDPKRDVVALASILVGNESGNPGCGRIRLDGVEFSGGTNAVTISYTDARDLAPSNAPIGCRLVGITARFAVALSIDHLPRGSFALDLARAGTGTVATARNVSVPGRPASLPANVSASTVDEAGTFMKGGLWARRGRSLWTSWDGARTWQRISLPVDPISVAVLDPSTVWLVSPTAGSIWPYRGQGELDVLHLVVNRTSDAGKTWQPTSLDGNFGGTQPVLRVLDGRGYLLSAGLRGGQATGLLTSVDGGRTWTRVRTPTNLPGLLGSAFAVAADESLWAGSQGDAGPVGRPILDVSRDGGKTWTDARLPGLLGDVSATDSVLGPPSFFGDSAIVAVSAAGGRTAVFSSDDGHHWRLACTLSLVDGDVSAFDPLDRATWFIANHRGISATRDSGQSWQELGLDGMPAGSRVDWLGFVDSRDGAALVGGASAQLLFVTHDGGQTWLLASLPSD